MPKDKEYYCHMTIKLIKFYANYGANKDWFCIALCLSCPVSSNFSKISLFLVLVSHEKVHTLLSNKDCAELHPYQSNQ